MNEGGGIRIFITSAILLHGSMSRYLDYNWARPPLCHKDVAYSISHYY